MTGCATKKASAYGAAENGKVYRWFMPNPRGKAEKKAHIQRVLLFRDLLLTFGGNQACIPFIEEEIDAILGRGQFFYGDYAKRMRGEPCVRHRNAGYLWPANQERCAIATGYALS